MSSCNIKDRSVPTHIAIILDGNGRWATRRHQLRGNGHLAGAQNVKRIVKAAADEGVKVLTLYAFSTENWKRGDLEVQLLMKLFNDYLKKYVSEMISDGVQLKVIGNISGLGDRLQRTITDAEVATQNGKKIVLNIALNYGGRSEIIEAINRCRKDISIDMEITEEKFKEYLYPSSALDVDLLIRTGGERRISNFLLWQISYAELYFTDVLWPDFTVSDLQAAIAYFKGRERRFGAV